MKLVEQENFSLVNFKISHEGCWTNLAKRYRIEISTLYTKADQRQNNIFGIVKLKLRRYSDLKDFIRDIAKSDSVHAVGSVSRIDLNSNLFKLEINERFKQMVSGTLHTFPILFRTDLVKNGLENEIIVVEERYVDYINEELKKFGDLLSFKVVRINITDFPGITTKLSPRERFALSKAIEEGYYDIPKKVYLRDLSNSTQLSKATIEEYIRKAEMKIMKTMKFWLIQS